MFYVLIVILFVKQNILILFKRNPKNKNKPYVKKSFDLFLLYLDNIYFLFLEVLYERSCSRKEPHKDAVYHKYQEKNKDEHRKTNM